ncbi:unnamed protein product, partial [Effrenium voratum]
MGGCISSSAVCKKALARKKGEPAGNQPFTKKAATWKLQIEDTRTTASLSHAVSLSGNGMLLTDVVPQVDAESPE